MNTRLVIKLLCRRLNVARFQGNRNKSFTLMNATQNETSENYSILNIII